MEGWKRVRLSDLVEIKHGFAFKGEYFTDSPTDTVLLTPGNFAIGGGFQWSKIKYYRDGPVPADYVLQPGDVLVTMTDLSKAVDTLGYSARVPESRRRLLHNQRLGKVVLKSCDTSLDFIHWLLRRPDYRNEILASLSGSTVKHTSPSKVGAYEFFLPPPFEQEAIAAILGALDDKIELNRRMNETLEAMARTLFKDWFVDFGPTRAKMAMRGEDPQKENVARATYLAPDIWSLFPDRLEGGKIPQGWSERSIYEISDVIYGAPFASALFNTTELGIPLIRIRDLANENPSVWTTEDHPKGYKVKQGDIVVGMDGEFRAHLWGGAEAWLNQRVCVFKPKAGYSAAFVRNSIIGPLAHVEATEIATTVIHLGKNDIDQFDVVVPATDVVAVYNELAQPLYNRVVENKVEIDSLAATRDLLLPKLMSGEIRVKDAEALVGEVA